MLKINDAMIGLVATFFDIAACVGFLLATQYKYLLFGKYILKQLLNTNIWYYTSWTIPIVVQFNYQFKNSFYSFF